MPPHERLLLLVELAGLEEDGVGQRHLPDVVEERAPSDVDELLAADAELLREPDGEVDDAPAVPLRFAVPQVEGADPPFERRLVGPEDLLRPAGRRLDGELALRVGRPAARGCRSPCVRTRAPLSARTVAKRAPRVKERRSSEGGDERVPEVARRRVRIPSTDAGRRVPDERPVADRVVGGPRRAAGRRSGRRSPRSAPRPRSSTPKSARSVAPGVYPGIASKVPKTNGISMPWTAPKRRFAG